jgi:hypothetical protein
MILWNNNIKERLSNGLVMIKLRSVEIFWNRTNNNKRMICGKLENKLEPKDSFRDHIANYFTELAGNQIPIDLLL